MNNRKEKTFSEVWGEFITSQTAKGVADITIRNYHQVLHNISKYLDIEMTLDNYAFLLSITMLLLRILLFHLVTGKKCLCI